ncbi:DoxX family protein [Nonlabens antarcticus]|uniref:DoxX family protein n=1 Tax=Nonlabens antarcticus TaxID=392714 RepID=UPI001890E1B3|nr:hypothetical protein [Nonlabens antarcticus]
MIKKILLILFVAFYAIAGIFHFIIPETYLKLIPEWLGDALTINLIAGGFEIIVAVLAIFPKTRKLGGYLAILMLLAFTISHIYFIQLGHCAGELCVQPWIGWVRLIVIHPMLIYWAYSISKLKVP